MDAIRPYSQVSTDSILSQTMESVGDKDPSTLKKDTGTPLHFDATRSASAHRAALGSDEKGIHDAAEAGIDKMKEKAIDKIVDGVAEMTEKFGGTIGAAFNIYGSVAQLGSLYNSGIEKPAREGDSQMALGASDAGVTAMVQTLDFSQGFKADQTMVHHGSSNVAAAMTASLQGNEGERYELQLRADKGFTDAAGYAKNAATVMKPLFDEAKEKLAQADRATDPAAKQKLLGEANEAAAKASEAQKKYLAPVLGSAQKDAAYGLGVLYAVHTALHGSSTDFDAAFQKANDRILAASPSTIHIQG